MKSKINYTLAAGLVASGLPISEAAIKLSLEESDLKKKLEIQDKVELDLFKKIFGKWQPNF